MRFAGWLLAMAAWQSGVEPFAFLGAMGVVVLGALSAFRVIRTLGGLLAWHNRVIR